jgi:hypothetical protein
MEQPVHVKMLLQTYLKTEKCKVLFLQNKANMRSENIILCLNTVS